MPSPTILNRWLAFSAKHKLCLLSITRIICTIYDIGEQGSRAFIATEFLGGTRLKHLICGHPMDPDKILGVAIEANDALDAAHAEGMAHRDINLSPTRRNPRFRLGQIVFVRVTAAGDTRSTYSWAISTAL